MIKTEKFIRLSKNRIKELDSGKLISLDEIANFFFDTYALYGLSDLSIKKISNEFNIDYNTSKKDFEEFVYNINDPSNLYAGNLPIENFMVLEPTNECSGNCVHCFHKTKEKISWDEKQIQDNIKFLIQNSIKYVSITGGEIFSPHFSDKALFLLKELNKANIKIISISTNALFINDNLLNNLTEILSKNVIFRFSIDSLDEVNILNIRPGYKDKNLYEAIKRIDSLGFNSVITTIISSQQKNDMLKIADFINNLSNVKTWNIRPMVPTKNTHTTVISNFNRIKEIYSCILSWYLNNTVKSVINLGNTLSTCNLEDVNSIDIHNSNLHPCKVDKNQRTLKAANRITRCPILPELSDKFLINMTDSIYNNYKLFDSLNTVNMKCNKCTLFKLCGGGCRLYAISHGLGIDGCDINSKLTLKWILEDKDDFFKKNWPDYYKYIYEVINND